MENFLELDNTMADIFDHMIETVLKKAEAGPRDLVGFEFRHNALQTPLLFPFSTRDSIMGEKLMNLIERVEQSHPDFEPDESMSIHVVVVHRN